MGLTVNRQMSQKLTVNRQKGIFLPSIVKWASQNLWRAVCFKIIFLGWSSTFCFRCMTSVETHALNCQLHTLYPYLSNLAWKTFQTAVCWLRYSISCDKFLLSFIQFSPFLVRLCTHNCISWVYINRSVLKHYPISYTHKSLPVLRVIS